jgi:hypothetical protein
VAGLVQPYSFVELSTTELANRPSGDLPAAQVCSNRRLVDLELLGQFVEAPTR